MCVELPSHLSSVTSFRTLCFYKTLVKTFMLEGVVFVYFDLTEVQRVCHFDLQHITP